MKTEIQHIEELKEAVLAKFARTQDAPADYDALSLDIANVTGESISVSTLKRLFGYDKYATTPRPSTLSALARYVGFAGWSDFCERNSGGDMCGQKPKLLIHNPRIIFVLVAIVVAVLISLVFVIEGSSVVSDTTPSSDKSQAEPKPIELSVESVREKWSQLSLQKCDSVRAYRHKMHVLEYNNVIDNFYFHYVFELMKQGVAEDIDKVENLSEQERSAAKSEIFSCCQNVCAELTREIAAELREYHYGQTQ